MARDFDGTTGHLLVTQTIFSGTPFTIAARFRSDVAEPATEMGIFIQQNFSLSNFYALKVEGSVGNKGTIRWAARESGTTKNAQTTTKISADTWHHVCGRETSSTDRAVFLDGGGKGTNTDLKSPSDLVRTHIGARSSSGSANKFFDGDIGHVAGWNVALTDDEILSLANDVSPLRMRRDALLFYLQIGGRDPELDIVGGVKLDLFGTAPVSEEPPIPYSILAGV